MNGYLDRPVGDGIADCVTPRLARSGVLADRATRTSGWRFSREALVGGLVCAVPPYPPPEDARRQRSSRLRVETSRAASPTRRRWLGRTANLRDAGRHRGVVSGNTRAARARPWLRTPLRLAWIGSTVSSPRRLRVRGVGSWTAGSSAACPSVATPGRVVVGPNGRLGEAGDVTSAASRIAGAAPRPLHPTALNRVVWRASRPQARLPGMGHSRDARPGQSATERGPSRRTRVVVRRGASAARRCWPNTHAPPEQQLPRAGRRPPTPAAASAAAPLRAQLPARRAAVTSRRQWGEYLSNRLGCRVVRVQLAPNGRARRVSAFASGFGHPLALLVDPGGGLLVADWGRGVVYRIQARGRS